MEPKAENKSLEAAIKEQEEKKRKEFQKKMYLGAAAVIVVGIIITFIVQGNKISQNGQDIKVLTNKVDSVPAKIKTEVIAKTRNYDSIIAEFTAIKESFSSKNDINDLKSNLTKQEKKVNKLAVNVQKLASNYSKVGVQSDFRMPNANDIIDNLKKSFLEKKIKDSLAAVKKSFTVNQSPVVPIIEKPNNKVSKDVVNDILTPTPVDTVKKTPVKSGFWEKKLGINKK